MVCLHIWTHDEKSEYKKGNCIFGHTTQDGI